MKNILDISVIIPTRNRKEVLKQAIVSICSGDAVPHQIIVIDQSDEPLKFQDIFGTIETGIDCVLVYQKKPSLTAARNSGIKKAVHEIILFMDDDILLNSCSLLNLYQDFRDKNVALVAAPHAKEFSYIKRYPDIFGTVFLRKKPFAKYGYVCKGAVLGRYPEKIIDVVQTEWAMGYFFAVRKSMIQKYNVEFDEKLISYAYAEDLDFTFSYITKANSQGYKAILDPNIYVNHLGAEEGRIPSNKATCMYVVHRYYISYKYFKGMHMRFMLLWSDIGEFLRRMIVRQNFMDILRTHWKCIMKAPKLKQGIIDDELMKLIQ